MYSCFSSTPARSTEAEKVTAKRQRTGFPFSLELLARLAKTSRQTFPAPRTCSKRGVLLPSLFNEKKKEEEVSPDCLPGKQAIQLSTCLIQCLRKRGKRASEQLPDTFPSPIRGTITKQWIELEQKVTFLNCHMQTGVCCGIIEWLFGVEEVTMTRVQMIFKGTLCLFYNPNLQPCYSLSSWI